LAKAGRRLAQEPRRFGRVRGAGVGQVRNARRKAALRSAVYLRGLAAQLATTRAARVTLGPSAVRAMFRLRRMSRAAQRATKALNRLPSQRKLETKLIPAFLVGTRDAGVATESYRTWSAGWRSRGSN
jgi:hypothetical protein